MLIDATVIDKANPYTQPPAIGPFFANPMVVEQQFDAGMWNFKGVPHYIEKALKVPYTYTDGNGVVIREYILIGFAGGGAY